MNRTGQKEGKLTVRLGGDLWLRREALQQTCAPRAFPPQPDDPGICAQAGDTHHTCAWWDPQMWGKLWRGS